MNPDLLIPATAALLDGWCGPVERASGRTGMLITWDGRLGKEVIPGRWVLDLGRAECADRVARALDPRGVTFAPNVVVEAAHTGGVWLVIGHRRYAYPAHLDPLDERTLPDGSRWVDRAALACVAREVLRG